MSGLARHIGAGARWVLPATYVGLIFYLSSRPQLPTPVSFPFWDKLAHLGEYTVLGALTQAAGGVRPGLRGVPSWRRAVVILAGGLLVAVLDERLQAQVPGRDPSLGDWVADACGLLLGGMLAWAWHRRRGGGRRQHG